MVIISTVPYLFFYSKKIENWCLSYQILNTSASFLLTVSTVQADWLTDSEAAVVTGLSEDLVRQDVLQPIGPRILKQSIMGPRAVYLLQLEAAIRQSLPADSLLEMECSVEPEGQIAWWTTGACHPAVKRQISQAVDGARGGLARESWRLPLHEAADGSPLVLLGRGGRILDILTGSEFNEIVIRSMTDSALLDHLLRGCADEERLPGLVDTFEVKKNGFRVLQFSSAETATAALKRLKDLAPSLAMNERDIGPWRAVPGRNSQPAAFELRVTVERRLNQSVAFIRFGSEASALSAAVTLGGALQLPNQTQVSIRTNKKDDKRSLVCYLRERFSILNKDVTEEQLLEALRARGVHPEGVRIPKEREFESTRGDAEAVKAALSRVFVNGRLCSPADFDIEVKPPFPKDFTWVAWLRFQTSATGLHCARYCEVGLIVRLFFGKILRFNCDSVMFCYYELPTVDTLMQL